VRLLDRQPTDLFGVEDRRTGRWMRLRAIDGRLVLATGGSDAAGEELCSLGGLPHDTWCFVGYASSALHGAGWLVVNDRVSGRLDASSADGLAAPFFGQVFTEESRIANLRAGWRAGGPGRFELGRAWIISRDCQPSTLLRLRDSCQNNYGAEPEDSERGYE
jgi:hypothetical protein